VRSRTLTVAIGGVAVFAIAIGSGNAAARHALGPFLIRWKRTSDALVELVTAARLAPDVARFGVVNALALDAAGKRDQADAALTGVVERHPFDGEALLLLVRYRLERHDTAGALTYARRLAAMEPGNSDVQRLVQRIASRGNH